MKITKYQNNVILLTFDTQEELTTTMIRPQEFYESPKFAGKVFDVNTYADWYRTTRKDGKFSYYTDWAGFNIPQKVIKDFIVKYALRNSIDYLEEKMLKLLDDNDFFDHDNGYLICNFGENSEDVIRHELVHATFHLSSDYRDEVADAIRLFLDDEMYEQLYDNLINMGYTGDVAEDEMNAYLIDFHNGGSFPFKVKNPEDYRDLAVFLNEIYNQFK